MLLVSRQTQRDSQFTLGRVREQFVIRTSNEPSKPNTSENQCVLKGYPRLGWEFDWVPHVNNGTQLNSEPNQGTRIESPKAIQKTPAFPSIGH
ncbi:hypothetical protein AVEN_124975-1 [Araneus ventricosus]|uniref:Uncharacterized protein n=1 Tax=Araneus ventricosus TaxID=182803 RepID=A0A4Y2VLE0_ARAVE|nr:hypothetical protein AVEN_124975-1 [Araneus ventricosus]